MNTMHEENDGKGGRDENFVEVAVVTTSGSYPTEGFSKVPVHQKIRVFLAEAARELKLTDVSNWVVRVNNDEIDPEKSYEENDLSGEIDIDFGPREGGGGDA